MKKLIYILIAIFTFSIGFWFFHFYFDKKINLTSTDKSVSLCEVSQNPQIYEHKQVRIKAFIENGGYYDMSLGTYVSDFRDGCAVGENLQLSESKQGGNIQISEQFKHNQTFTNLLRELNEKRREPEYVGRDGWAIVEVEIIGELKVNRNNGFIDEQTIELEPTEIKQLSSIKFVRANENEKFPEDLRKILK